MDPVDAGYGGRFIRRRAGIELLKELRIRFTLLNPSSLVAEQLKE
jgi:hypothetical protein